MSYYVAVSSAKQMFYDRSLKAIIGRNPPLYGAFLQLF